MARRSRGRLGRALRRRRARTPHADRPQRPQGVQLAVLLGAIGTAALLASLASASASGGPRSPRTTRPTGRGATSPTASPTTHASRRKTPSQTTYSDLLAHVRLPKGTHLLLVGAPARVHPVRPGFLGLSLEYPAVTDYAGGDPFAINPVFLQLVRNLSPGQEPVLRIGGDSTDWTWWPVPGMARPGGIRYSLTPGWLQVTRALATELGARLILGLNLEAANPRIPATEADALLGGIPPANIDALEPGNEPELYGSWTYYRARDGRKVTGRRTGYTFSDFERDFGSVRRQLPRTPLAGPTTGSLLWMAYLRRFLATQPRLALLSLHRYPLQLCYFPPSSPRYPTIAHLLSPDSSRGLAQLFTPYVEAAHAHGVPVRIDELNTIGCGKDPRVAQTFAAALWALDTLYALAQRGVDGVNVHTYPHATYDLFRFSTAGGRWHARVMPEYYGLQMFALAVPPGSQPLTLSGSGTRALSAWATRGPHARIRVMLINEGAHAQRIGIRAPVQSARAALVRMTAPHATSSGGITLAGESFGAATSTGRLAGRLRVAQVHPTGRTFVVTVPATSATLVTLP